ncbi:MAG: regulatory protein RecX [Desulfobacteraceae bacterium]|nr:regulatory protein RecX [Desulfobacteraceae bacterium]
MAPKNQQPCDGRGGIITSITMETTPLMKRAVIFVDNRRAAHAHPCDSERLAVGHPISDQALAELQRRHDHHGAYLQAVRFLGPRNRSTSEIWQHLTTRGWNHEASHQAIERLKQEGYVDDRLFARQWIDYRCRTAPRSRMAVMQELKQKGIAPETILSAVATMDEAALALDCAQRKARQWLRYDGAQKEQRIAAFLQRKGFPFAVCRETARALAHPSQED